MNSFSGDVVKLLNLIVKFLNVGHRGLNTVSEEHWYSTRIRW